MTATPPETRPLRGLGSALGIVISVVCLAAVVWWALQQDPPQLPHTPREIGALVLAIALYGVNTLVRSERWHRLLVDDGAAPARADSYSLTTVGYAVNNVLPARAGDAARVVLMAPRAETTKRTPALPLRTSTGASKAGACSQVVASAALTTISARLARSGPARGQRTSVSSLGK